VRDRIATSFERLIQSRYGLISIVLLVGLLVGVLWAGDYGISVDEHHHEIYARETLESYWGFRNPLDTRLNLRYYGPFFSLISNGLTNILARLHPGWYEADARHFTYFLTFLMAVFCVNILCRRFVSRNAALIASLLFASQPLLLGHAFINPKDIPFMAFLLATVTIGFTAADELKPGAVGEIGNARHRFGIRPLWAQFVGVWRRAHWINKLLLSALLAVTVVVGLDLFVYKQSLVIMHNTVEHAYNGVAWGPINTLFRYIAEDVWKTPLELYIAKVDRFFGWSRYLVVGMLSILVFLASKRIFGWSRRYLVLVAAGVVLGACTSVRVMGPFAGALVSALFVVRARTRALPALVLYWGVAAITTFLTWPFLWDAPIQRFIESLLLMSDFSHKALVLYQGQLTISYDLPWHFVPFLLLVQFTLPAVLLSVIGMAISLRRLKWFVFQKTDLFLIFCWGALPLLAKVILNTRVYDNFRQLLFLVPPFFILGSVAVESILMRIRGKVFSVLAIGLILLPGIIGVLYLHPYEYIYYNALVGWSGGAFREYELDYWCTSQRAAMEYVNSIAPEGAVVGQTESPDLVTPFARRDLFIVDRVKPEAVPKIQPDLVIVCNRANQDLSYLPEAEVLWRVEKAGATLAVVKKVR
jgi:hypothetical protein